MTEKLIPPTSKFTSELDINDPADAEEMDNRVFGRGYKTDRQGNPVDASRCSDAFWVSDQSMPKAPRDQQVLLTKLRDCFQSHLSAIAGFKGENIEASDIEFARINGLRRKAGLEPWPRPGFRASGLGAGINAAAPKPAVDEI